MPATIALLPGDGTGPEVLAEGRRVLEAAAERFQLDLDLQEVACGARHYEETGEEWEEGGFAFCRDEADAILLGAIGWPGVTLPSGDIAGAGVVFGLRFGLDLYANVRPCKLYEGVPHKIHDRFRTVWEPELVDMVIVRENTEGLYTPARGQLERGGVAEVATDTSVITRKGAERVIRYAFELSDRRGRGAPADDAQRVTCVDKSNVLTGSRLFRAVYDEVAEGYPHIGRDYSYIDAFTQWLVRKPEWYDVAVTTNMLGDIATDLAAVLQGGMGMAASGNVGDDHAMFEPVHGSSPKHAGENRVNPLACIFSVQMMLGWLGERRGGAEGDRFQQAADVVEAACADVLTAGKPRTYDLGGSDPTDAVGRAVAERVAGE